jgi:hypothetical protein
MGMSDVVPPAPSDDELARHNEEDCQWLSNALSAIEELRENLGQVYGFEPDLGPLAALEREVADKLERLEDWLRAYEGPDSDD